LASTTPFVSIVEPAYGQVCVRRCGDGQSAIHVRVDFNIGASLSDFRTYLTQMSSLVTLSSLVILSSLETWYAMQAGRWVT